MLCVGHGSPKGFASRGKRVVILGKPIVPCSRVRGPSDCFTWPVTTGGVVLWVGCAGCRTCMAACVGVRVAQAGPVGFARRSAIGDPGGAVSVGGLFETGGAPETGGRGVAGSVASASSAVVVAATSPLLRATAASEVGPGFKRCPIAHPRLAYREEGTLFLISSGCALDASVQCTSWVV